MPSIRTSTTSTDGADEGTTGRAAAPKARRGWFGKIVRGLLWCVAAVLALVWSALFHLDTEAGRTNVCGLVEAQLQATFEGDFELERCESLALDDLRIAGASVRVSPDAEPFLRLESIHVRPDVVAIFSGNLVVDEVHARGGWTDVRDPTVFERAFATRVPSVDDGPPSLVPTVVLRQVRLEELGARLTDDLEVFADVDGSVQIEDGLGGLRIEVGQVEARGRLERDGESVATFETLEDAGVELGRAGITTLELQVVSEESRVRARGEMAWADDLGDGPGTLSVDTEFEVGRALFRRLGLPEVAGVLATDLRGTAHVEGPLAALAATAELTSDGGTLRLAAAADEDAWNTSVSTRDFALVRAVGVAPDAIVDADLEVRIEPTDAGAYRFVLDGSSIRYAPADGDEIRVPEIHARAVVEENRAVLESVDVPHLSEGGHLTLSGAVAFDGSGNAVLDADLPQLARDPNVRALVPGLRTGVRVQVRAEWTPTTVEASGDVVATDLHYGTSGAARAEVRGRVSGNLPTPDAQLRIELSNARSGDLSLRNLHMQVAGARRSGGLAHYRVTGDADRMHEGRREAVNLDLDVGVGAGNLFTADGHAAVTGIWRLPLALRLNDVRVDPRGVRIGRLTLDGRELDLDVHGTYAFRGSSNLVAALHGVPLEVVDRRLGLGLQMRGIASGHATVRGTVSAPSLDAEIRLDEFGLRDLPLTAVRGSVHIGPADTGGSEAHGQLAARGGWGDLELTGRGQYDRPDELMQAAWTVDLNGRNLQLSSLLTAVPDLSPADVPVDGSFGLVAALRGTTDAPTAHVELTSQNLRYDRGDPIEFSLNTDLSPARVQLQTTLSDAHGPLVRAELDSPLEPTLFSDFSPERALDLPFRVVASVPLRKLQQLPRPLRVDLPLRAQAELEVLGGPDGPTARVRSRTFWTEEGECSDSMVGATVELRDETVTAHLRLLQDRVEVATADSQTEAPLRRWLQTGFPTAPPVLDVDASGANIALARVPIACAHATGTTRFTAQVRNLFGPDPSVRVDASVADLVMEGTEALDIDLAANANADEGTAEISVRARDRLAAELRARAPLDWSEGLPALGAEPWNASVSLDRAPVAVLVAPVPSLEQPAGHLDGEIRLSGQGEEVRARGGVELLDVSLTVRDPFVRVERLGGRIALNDRGLELRDIRMEDRDGELRLNGRIDMDGWTPTAAELELYAHEMPARVDGVIFAFVNAQVDVEARLRDERAVDVRMREVAVRLPEESGRAVQRLNGHDDVIYEDDVRFSLAPGTQLCDDGTAPPCPTPLEVAQTETDEEEEEEATPPLVVQITARPFWVRRDDFAIQLSTDLRLVVDDRGARLTGPVDVRRGFIVLLGKRFEMRRSEIRFSGAADTDPRLDIIAVHELRTGAPVTVHIGGFLSRPTLTFSSPGAESERDVIALLVRGRAASQTSSGTARDQAASVLAGLMAGLLSSLTRREIGQYIPVFSIESDDSRSARIRAGFQADSLIPEFLEGVVNGVYVEGFVGTEGQDGGQSTTGGFLIELLFPRHLVGSGTYEEPSNWSLDLTWEPL